MKKNHRSAAILSTLYAVLASGCMMSADDAESFDDAETLGTVEEAVAPGAAVWKGDVRVLISAVKDTVAQRITYTITAKNLGDDDARNIIITHTPSYAEGLNGINFVSVSASTAACQGSVINGVVLSVTCSPITLAVGATATVTVVVNNPGNLARTGTAQAMGITPDPVPANNFAIIDIL